jgi:very-short-patch-repair endonuclease
MANLGKTTNYKFHYNAYPVAFANAKSLRRTATLAEKLIWKELKNNKLSEFKIRRQHPVGQFVVDFFCARKNLVIEIDGEIHMDPEVKARDDYRTLELENLGLKVIRFTNSEVMNNMEDVLARILNNLKS